MKTPLTIITGTLGAGKTTLLLRIIDTLLGRFALLINEFGELNIDAKRVKGKNVELAELQGGCVCCSLIGEFEDAVVEIIDTVDPEYILVETTGVAEPDALIFDIQESLPMIRLDGVVTIVDADMMIRFPQVGQTTRMQIADGDILVLNKSDLVNDNERRSIEKKLREINSSAAMIPTQYCQVDPELLFGIARKQSLRPRPHKHQLKYNSMEYQTEALLRRDVFDHFIVKISDHIIRAKGFVNFENGTFLFNFVNGRWDFEPYGKEKTSLVFIGKNLNKARILSLLQSCEEK